MTKANSDCTIKDFCVDKNCDIPTQASSDWFSFIFVIVVITFVIFFGKLVANLRGDVSRLCNCCAGNENEEDEEDVNHEVKKAQSKLVLKKFFLPYHVLLPVCFSAACCGSAGVLSVYAYDSMVGWCSCSEYT